MRPHVYQGVVVTGIGVTLPGANRPAAVLAGRQAGVAPVDTMALLGRKGLRYQDRATRLAHCAAGAALADAGLLADGELTVPQTTVGIVASSNTGNLDAVTRSIDTMHTETTDAVSPMDLPKVAGNVIASAVAIRYRLRGPNLMMSNGATSGLDAVRWAAALIEAGRLERAVVLGVEPDTEATRALLPGTPLDGAVALVVEGVSSALARGVPLRARLGGHVRGAGVAACVAQLSTMDILMPVAAWYVPGPTVSPRVLPGVPRHDLTTAWGQCSGALGVLQCAAAVHAFEGDSTGVVYAVAGDDGHDATAGVVLTPPARHNPTARTGPHRPSPNPPVTTR